MGTASGAANMVAGQCLRSRRNFCKQAISLIEGFK